MPMLAQQMLPHLYQNKKFLLLKLLQAMPITCLSITENRLQINGIVPKNLGLGLDGIIQDIKKIQDMHQSAPDCMVQEKLF